MRLKIVIQDYLPKIYAHSFETRYQGVNELIGEYLFALTEQTEKVFKAHQLSW